MKFSSICNLGALCGIAQSAAIPSISKRQVHQGRTDVVASQRPLLHAAPERGWINDPNGLWYDSKEGVYHLYYQYNPADTVWDRPLSWGHMTSKDLMTWEEHEMAIIPDREDGGAYSGCMVVDTNNTSGLFNDTVDPAQRAVAIWTYDVPGSETQYMSYSTDGGYTFTQYGMVLDIGSDQFRDPKVFWHEESSKWIMSVTASHLYSIQIYSSTNLKDWTYESEFSHKGFLGYQYECSGLAKVPLVKALNNDFNLTSNSYRVTNNDTDYVWVMILAINPGGPLGGSFNQYFIGDFDGHTFNSFTSQTRLLDFGKDFYAFQSFYNFPDDSGLYGIAWASNWQYSAYIPADTWRASMTMVRKLTVQQYAPTPENVQLTVVSTPMVHYAADENKNFQKLVDVNVNSNDTIHVDISNDPTGAFEFDLTFITQPNKLSKKESGDLTFLFKGAKDSSEYIRFGYSIQSDAFFIDRGNTNVPFVHENPFFTDKFTVNSEPWQLNEDGLTVHKVRGIFDINLLELFFNEGTMASTNIYLFSPDNKIGSVDIYSSVDDYFNISEFVIREYTVNNKTEGRRVTAI